MFILYVLEHFVLADQFLTTERVLVMLLFQTVLIFIAHFHVADHIFLETAVLTTVLTAELLFLKNVPSLHAVVQWTMDNVHVTDNILFNSLIV